LTSFHANSDCAVNTVTASTQTKVAIDREVVGVESSRKTVVSSVLHARSTASSGSLGIPDSELERDR
jgi:aconitase B